VTHTSTRHDTVVVKHSYPTSPARVFAAWTDPETLARWYMPGDDSWSSHVVAHDFRVGGVKQLTFGERGSVPYSEDCRYEDIVTDRRLCYSMTIARSDRRITTSMVTVELLPIEGGTEVVVTDQLVILDGGDTAADREKGWGETLEKLTLVL
jgi:uncharacterized protein YndB with AHSA1/START domain